MVGIIRMLLISGFSLTAATLMLYQGIEFYHAFIELMKNK